MTEHKQGDEKSPRGATHQRAPERELELKLKKNPHDDEKTGTQYNYSVFHLIFMLSTAWIATLLTQALDPTNDAQSDFVPVGRTYWASWVKIVSAWVCYVIYAWALVAPVVLPERFDY